MISKILREYRKSCKYTQEEVAKLLHITRQAYNNYETGVREPNIDMLRRLCIIFECTSDELLEIDTPLARKKIAINNSFNNIKNSNIIVYLAFCE